MTARHNGRRASRAVPDPAWKAKAARQAERRGFWLRAGAFLVLTVASLVAVALVWPRVADVGPAEQSIQIDMAGFSPEVLTATVGQPLRVKIVNPDSPFHTDGGGWHQLAIPDLGVDAWVAPRTQQVVELPAAAAPGEYAFYCDVCCGGKENPTMQGILKVSA
jgi:hypothetical protein